ncbi:CDP-alcohol phosphatidyltransferase family protein [Flavobacterium sp. HXWNR29]|jgi:CDP-diacylglycerol--serine O-phosphatidyltransferase|uniref:CDP-alcohol phosphatidyltransferase family protein n=1 Tax=Flavobacterium odoriferum TaxID=2946604 RepID=UPI0021CAF793|nr:CDP-alcohol phosphatidyltransferase family protein [Flavobacterium sp. HXWNR29]MCU4189495.1 CDP-alcohol phosphatidyltransferase family protein [Flavobacterium sp. HXWNR29]
MQIKKHIPNTITLLNLASGLLAVIAVFKGYYDEAFIFVCLGIFFDFWDGFLARKFKVSGELGLQLDSLADVVTSGVVPGLMMFKLFQDIQEDDTSKYFLTEEFYYMGFVPYLGFIITLASAYRLAKFNIDTRQTDSFIGLPTPANALLIMSIPMIQYAGTHEWLVEALYNPFILLAITILSAYMLNAEIPLFSLKMKDFSWEKNKLQVIFLALSVVLLFLIGFTALPVIILLYVALSVINNTVLAKK